MEIPVELNITILDNEIEDNKDSYILIKEQLKKNASILIKNKSIAINNKLNEYNNFLINKSNEFMNSILNIQNKERIYDVETIPTLTNYLFILNKKLNINSLKIFLKHYNLKITGNKSILLSRLFNYFYLSTPAIKIQKLFRGHLQRKCNLYHGSAFFNRELCTNTNDFLTMDDLKELRFSQFFSYKDIDGFIYGFDIISLHNLYIKSGKNILNPYNRNKIPDDVYQNLKNVIRLSKLLKIDINIEIQDINMDISIKKSLELRILDLFQNINSLGNYSEPTWFSTLNIQSLHKFTRELFDIWEYRAQLSFETKKLIYPPYGELFYNININYIFTHEPNIINIQKIVLSLMEKLVNSGVEKDNRTLGSYFVLSALTLVSENAASSLPWLYQSVSHF
jgi:hypothetical protein